jgi:membrane protein implicated in regulation of membrane protease activity
MSGFFTRLALSIAALLIVLVAALIAMGYFAFALYLFLLNSLSPPLAAAATGILVLLLAIFLVLATRPRSGPQRRRYAAHGSDDARATAAELGGELGRRLQGLASSHKTGSIVAALIAGFAVGVSPKLRGFLMDILKP